MQVSTISPAVEPPVFKQVAAHCAADGPVWAPLGVLKGRMFPVTMARISVTHSYW